MLKKFTDNYIKTSIAIVTLFGAIIIVFFNIDKTVKIDKVEKKVIEKKSTKIKEYPYRKYLHVKNFYKDLAQKTVELGLKYNVPPAAILAISGVESGYGRGYVGRITGNILSLGAKSNEAELPALKIPNLRNDKSKVIYSKEEIDSYDESELQWKQRPASLKKDYRPKSIAGTKKELDYFDKNIDKKIEANLECFEDFAKVWINKNKKLKPFVEARMMLDQQIKLHSKEILFDKKLNERFIQMIGGRKNSFNYRNTWPPKVIQIMNKIGLVELTKSLHVSKKTFADTW